VHVEVGVAVAVVVAVVRGPPQGALLDRRRPAEGHDELHAPTQLVAAMGEVPVVPGGDEEHPHEVQDGAHDQGPGVDARDQRGKAGDVHEEERDRGDPVDPFVVGPFDRMRLHGVSLRQKEQGRWVHRHPTDW
jgi:hypothetical protein